MSRLKSADYSKGTTTAYQVSSTLAHDLSGISYDKNGNVKTLTRRNSGGGVVDGLAYSYTTGTNKLSSLTDSGITYESAHPATFAYDALGNVNSYTEQTQGYTIYFSTTTLSYDTRNLPITARVQDYDLYYALTSDVTTRYRYSYDGQRLSKKVGTAAGEHYLLDGAVTLAAAGETSGSMMTCWGEG